MKSLANKILAFKFQILYGRPTIHIFVVRMNMFDHLVGKLTRRVKEFRMRGEELKEKFVIELIQHFSHFQFRSYRMVNDVEVNLTK